jgi:hypothetical protein
MDIFFPVILSAAKDLIAACHRHEILRCAQDDNRALPAGDQGFGSQGFTSAPPKPPKPRKPPTSETSETSQTLFARRRAGAGGGSRVAEIAEIAEIKVLQAPLTL